MSSKTVKPVDAQRRMAHLAVGNAGIRRAAPCWSLSFFIALWPTTSSAAATHGLSGEVEVLGDVAEQTPKNALYDRVVGEVAELAGKEVPNKLLSESSSNDSVFFLQTGDER